MPERMSEQDLNKLVNLLEGLHTGGSISAHFVGGESGAQSYLKAKHSVTVRKMYLGKVTVDRFTTDIEEPVENMTFDSETVRIMKLRMES